VQYIILRAVSFRNSLSADWSQRHLNSPLLAKGGFHVLALNPLVILETCINKTLTTKASREEDVFLINPPALFGECEIDRNTGFLEA
jgi:hypothetical protein